MKKAGKWLIRYGLLMAGPTRLELATSGVTGRRSDQLNYDPARVMRAPQGVEERPEGERAV
jgi:hypothetical protein